MDLFNEKYHKLVKEEDNFNYKYNPILTSAKINRRKLSDIFRDNINLRKIKILKEKEKANNNRRNIKEKTTNDKFINDNSLIKKEPVLEEKFFLKQIQKKKEILLDNKNKIKGYLTKSQCPFCKKSLLEKDNEKSEIENILLSHYNNYLDIKSYIVFKANNFPLINLKFNKYYSFKKKLNEEKEDKMKTYKMTFDKKADMESELSKNKKNKKFKEIKRGEIKMNNLYQINRPLLTTMRGKIYKNMRQRFKRPMRFIILETKNIHPVYTSNIN